MKTWKDVPGWFLESDADFYRAHVDKAKDGDVFVEVGCCMGRSTRCMCELIRESGKNINFYAVDSWAPDYTFNDFDIDSMRPQMSFRSGVSLFDLFIRNTASVAKYVTIVPMCSVDAARKFEDKSISFVFIDADHSYEGVRTDIRTWWPKVKPKGTLAGHDYEEWKGVKKAVNERFGEKQIRRRSLIDNIWKVNKL